MDICLEQQLSTPASDVGIKASVPRPYTLGTRSRQELCYILQVKLLSQG